MTLKIGRHYRAPWRPLDPEHIWVNCRFDVLKGAFQQSSRDARVRLERYERAKRHFDMSAAFDIVNECIAEPVIELVVDAIIKVNKPPVIVSPHPEFDGGSPCQCDAPLPTNALPFAFAARLAAELGCEVDSDITEIARPGRTKLNLFQRFKWQPAFAGEIRSDRSYIIIDDVCTIAGTLAMLRSYIVEHGGTVIAATTLAHTNGRHQTFPIAAHTVRVLRSLYTNEIDNLWKEEVGHGVESLTENEGNGLVEWARARNVSSDRPSSLLQLLRDRLAQVSEKGS